jgi:hypothetical protein
VPLDQAIAVACVWKRFRLEYRYTEQDWTAEEFSGGGYSTVFAPGVATQVAWNALEPMGNLLFACSDLSESSVVCLFEFFVWAPTAGFLFVM